MGREGLLSVGGDRWKGPSCDMSGGLTQEEPNIPALGRKTKLLAGTGSNLSSTFPELLTTPPFIWLSLSFSPWGMVIWVLEPPFPHF